MDTKTLAQRGLKVAATFLQRRGYDLLEKNWQCDAGEIDLIAYDKDENEVVFVEVKTRRSSSKGFPSDHWSAKKREQLEKIAIAYLADHDDFDDCRVRFDTVALVVLSEARAMIRHHLNAFAAAPAA